MISQQRNREIFWKQTLAKSFKRQIMSHIFFKILNLLGFATKIKLKSPLINFIHGCLCSDYLEGYAMEMFFFFCFGTACPAIIFAVVTCTTISCNLSRWYQPMISLHFFDVYGQSTS